MLLRIVAHTENINVRR